MARRSDHTREELKELAISCGKKIIAKEGYSNFSARKLAKAMGYTVGTLYNIFENYNAIVLSINARTMDSMREFIIKNTLSEKNNSALIGGEAIKNLAQLYMTFAQKNYNLWCALFEFNLPQGISCPPWYSQKIKDLCALVEEPLLPLLKDKEEAERVAQILWVGVHGICQMGFTGKLDMQQAELMEILTNVFIDYYTKGIKNTQSLCG